MSTNIVFMGSPEFAVKILSALTEDYTIRGVVTQPDRPAGRGKIITPPPVKTLAAQLGLPVIQPEKLRDPGVFEQLQAWDPDLIVVAAFGQILRPKVLDLPRFGCINVHASYLPRWRGAAPIQAAILNGDEYTGVTIMKMDPGIDTGPMLRQEKVTLEKNETLASLNDKLANAGATLLMQTLVGYLEGSIQPVAQPETGETYAPMLKKEDGLLDFTSSMINIDRKVRALNDWPGTYTLLNGQPLKIRKVSIMPGTSDNAGKHSIIDRLPAIGTPDGWVKLLEVQPAGKKWMSGADFLRGIQNWQLD